MVLVRTTRLSALSGADFCEGAMQPEMSKLMAKRQAADKASHILYTFVSQVLAVAIGSALVHTCCLSRPYDYLVQLSSWRACEYLRRWRLPSLHETSKSASTQPISD